jgi:dephospho-CoA kinase|tara:strand:- start:1383 stop:1994 length:612 start_codon:yes stop_codon:yes gene_type:complete
MKSKTIILGITGSIATGKSTIIKKLLDEFNPEYCDADKLVHTLYEPGKPAYYRIIEIFGQEIVNEKTSYINRQKLGEIVFKDKNSMKKLTDAIGNIGIEVKNLVDSWIEDSKKLGIVEAVNLIEANYIAWCDEVWLFKVDNNIALERLKNRNNLSQNEAEKRINSQTPWKKRIDYANFTIDTNGNIDEVYTKVKKLYLNLIKI